MVKIFSSQSLLEVEALKSRLEEEGIPCFVKNQFTSLLAGAVPFTDVFPALWITRVQDVERAQELLALWRESPVAHSPGWRCHSCGEQHDGQFTACWKCGAENTP